MRTPVALGGAWKRISARTPPTTESQLYLLYIAGLVPS